MLGSKSGKVNTLVITTPEGIEFSFYLASPILRCLAWSIDIFCILAISLILSNFLSIFGIISRDLVNAVTTIAYFIAQIGYSIITEWYLSGQTLGKRLFKMRVIDIQGLHLQLSQVVVRNLLRAVDSFPWCYLVGGISCLVSPKAQRLGDFAANTIVIRYPSLSEPDLDQIMGDKYNSFRNYPHLAARLRKHISPQEAGIAYQALIRRGVLEPASRIRLFSYLVSHFSKIVEFPQEVTDGISDEQYVRNVVDIIGKR